MRAPRLVLMAAALVALDAAHAAAGSIYSGALTPPAGGYLRCSVVNPGNASREVDIEVMGGESQVVQDQQDILVQVNYVASISGVGGRWCRFRFKGARGALRFSAETLDAALNPLSALEAR